MINLILDWVFDIKPIFGNCPSRDQEECELQGFFATHEFNQSVYAPSSIEVKCEPEMREDTLPDWTWRVNDLKGKEHAFTKFIDRYTI